MARKIGAIIASLVVVLGILVYAQAQGSPVEAATATPTPAAAIASPAITGTAAFSETTAVTGSVALSATTVAEALADNQKSHAKKADYTWDENDVVPIVLSGQTATANDPGVRVEGGKVTITAAGVYSLSGELSDGQIVVDTKDEELVRLILAGVDIHNDANAPVFIANADRVLIVLADGTENFLSDGAEYVYAAADEDEPNAALYSKADLTIGGTGALTVEANYNDAITSKDGLVIHSGTLMLTAVDDGIRGKDYLIIEDGQITVNAQGDALKADNDEETERGYIAVLGGALDLTAGDDAFDAETDVLIASGDINIVAGGGSGAQVDDDASAKGIKGAVSVIIDDGTLEIDAADDAVHANGSIVINDGVLAIASGDDAIHADAMVTINGGNIEITESYEGIESAAIIINDGTIRLVASDDGINASDGSGAAEIGPGAGGAMGGGVRRAMPPPGAPPAGGADFPGQPGALTAGSNYLHINGGYIVVNAAGDGLDANGTIAMTGGTLLVDGPTNSGNGALDYDAGFDISGGLLVAAGSAGMAQAPSASSSQNSLLVNFTAVQPAGTLVAIVDSAGESVLTYAPSKAYQSLVFSSSALKLGERYAIYTGGSDSGTAVDGLYADGVYTPGALYAEVPLTGVVTSYGASGRRR